MKTLRACPLLIIVLGIAATLAAPALADEAEDPAAGPRERLGLRSPFAPDLSPDITRGEAEDEEPPGDYGLVLRLMPSYGAFIGDVKQGPRGRTERLRLREDLDISPFIFGFAIDARLNYRRLYSLGLEYLVMGSTSPQTKTRSEPITRFDNQSFPQGSRTRARIRYEKIRLELAYTFADDWYRIDLLLGVHYTITSLDVRSAFGDSVARTRTFFPYFPGVVAGIQIFGELWGRLELRNAFVSIPFGNFVTDARLVFSIERDQLSFGFGGQIGGINIQRLKERVFPRKVNLYRDLDLYGIGVFFEGGIRF